ncbi:MAG: alpha-ribazole phosphatase/probable phosphoglycerate mutase [Chloroflexi bacterium]|nr:MAG: alpha-ribazole phosphatase/probable phosphoglycerate mutase [Chloroflexota bacterium]
MGRVILVRHAESEANRDHTSLGRADSPLTDHGRVQVRALAQALAGEPITRVLTSPLSRAADAADAIAAHHTIPAERHEALLEMDVGDMEGLPWDQARLRYSDFLDRWSSDDSATVSMPGGESLLEVQRRAWPVLEPILTDTHTAGTTVLVSHNFVVKVLICAALDLDIKRWRIFETDLTGRTVLEPRRGLIVLRTLNDFSHLSRPAASPTA